MEEKKPTPQKNPIIWNDSQMWTLPTLNILCAFSIMNARAGSTTLMTSHMSSGDTWHKEERGKGGKICVYWEILKNQDTKLFTPKTGTLQYNKALSYVMRMSE